jgi:undecaprenyl-diphosphatase
MALWHLLLLAILQGATEFLPVSSSGHLILLPGLTGLEDQGTFLDIAVHLGSLGAVVLYFRDDVARAIRGLIGLLQKKWGADERLAAGLIIGTIPVILFGLLIKLTVGTEALRSVALIGFTTLGFGLLLAWADLRYTEEKTDKDWTLRDAVVFGLWQMLALIPGTSRSGIVITAGRFLDYTREDAARLSMLMSIPTIIASGTLLTLDVVDQANWALARDGAIAAVFAFGSALLALVLMMRLLRSVSFLPYVIYRVILGTGLLIWAYA